MEIEKQEPIERHAPEPISNIERLAQELSDTNKHLKQAFSLRMIVLRGLITGFAIVVGSTIFASIAFSIIRYIFGDVSFVPTI